MPPVLQPYHYSRKRREGLYAGSDILSREYPPLPGPRLDGDTSSVEADSTPIFLRFSRPPETQWSRSTDRGWPQCRRWHFLSTPRACPFNVL